MLRESRVWFITGASTGIGRELANETLARGHRVVATARRPEVLQDLVDRYPEHALAVRLDVTDTSEVAHSIRTLRQLSAELTSS